MKIIIRVSAEKDIREVYEWYENTRSGLGDEFLEDLTFTFQYLQRFPVSFRQRYKTFRIISLKRFPYLVYFRLTREAVVIQKIGHARRSKRKLKI